MRKIRRRRPRPRPRRPARRRRAERGRRERPAASDAKVVIIVGRRRTARRQLPRRRRTQPTPRRSSTPRTSSRSTARTRRGRPSRPAARAPRSSSTSATATAGPARTRYDPDVHDQGRLRAQRNGAGSGDYNTKYYGEPYIATLDLAPNAIVLLHHLCYASGNSEPGRRRPDPVASPSSASTTTRPAFLKAGAPGGHRRRPQRARALPPRRCSRRAPVDRRPLARRPELPRPRCSRSPSIRTPGLHRLHGPRHARRAATTARSSPSRASPPTT